MSVPILEVIDLHAAYGRIEVLRGVDLAIPKGAVMALLGPNGAGKSTLVKVISGQKALTSGDIHLAGVHVKSAGSEDLARVGLCTIPEGRSVFPNLTIEENLRLMSYAGIPAGAVLDTAFSYFPRLHERRRQLAGTLSGGEQQMVAIGRALMARPKLLLLDEPSMGLAPIFVERIFEIIREINSQGTPILLVEQNALMALDVAQRGYVLETGNIALADDAKKLRENEEVRKTYLGATD